MSAGGVHHGFLKKYGGFMFKQWKEKYLVLTVEGNLLVCRDAVSPPDQLVALQRGWGFMFKQWKEKYLVLTVEGNLLVCRDRVSPPDQLVALQRGCESIVEGREILDLPRLPPGGRRDCCFALILPQDKFLLLLSDNPEDCMLWLNLLRKVREGVTSPLGCQRQQSLVPCITDRDPLPDTPNLNELRSPLVSEGSQSSPGTPPTSRPGSFRDRSTPPLSRLHDRGGSVRERGSVAANGPRRTVRSASVAPPHRVSDCLRHGNSSDARAVRAVCLLMGGAAASSALGYLNSVTPTVPLSPRATDLNAHSTAFSDMSAGGSFHACGQDVEPPHFNSCDFDGDADFDAGFDCGGFVF